MEYFFKVLTSNNVTLSCDKLRLKFVLNEFTFKKLNQFFEDLSFNNSKYMFKLHNNFNLFSYRYFLEFSSGDSVVAVGLCFNGISKEDYFSCFIEFNPNKSMVNGFVQPIMDYLKTIVPEFELVRYDFAIDLPLKRSLVVLKKDKRNFSKVYKFTQSDMSCENITEYLGKRNNNGFVKLYNKSIESNLNYDLTRLEITLEDYSYENFVKEFPVVYTYNNLNLISFEDFNDTDRTLLQLLLNSQNTFTYLNMLGRVKKEKFTNVLLNAYEFGITEFEFYSFVSKVKAIYS